jgi:hypothetical protein
MPTLDEFRQLGPDEQQSVLADMRQKNEAIIRAELGAVFGTDWSNQLVPHIVFRPVPTQTINLDPPRMSDEEVRGRFRNDPNLRELIVAGVKYERI